MYLRELHELKNIPKSEYAKTGLIKVIPRTIHNLELDILRDGTNILVIKTIFGNLEYNQINNEKLASTTYIYTQPQLYVHLTRAFD